MDQNKECKIGKLCHRKYSSVDTSAHLCTYAYSQHMYSFTSVLATDIHKTITQWHKSPSKKPTDKQFFFKIYYVYVHVCKQTFCVCMRVCHRVHGKDQRQLPKGISTT